MRWNRFFEPECHATQCNGTLTEGTPNGTLMLRAPPRVLGVLATATIRWNRFFEPSCHAVLRARTLVIGARVHGGTLQNGCHLAKMHARCAS